MDGWARKRRAAKREMENIFGSCIFDCKYTYDDIEICVSITNISEILLFHRIVVLVVLV